MTLPDPVARLLPRLPVWAHWGGHWARWRVANGLRMAAERLDPTPPAGPSVPGSYLAQALDAIAARRVIGDDLIAALAPGELAQAADAARDALDQLADDRRARHPRRMTVVPDGAAQGRADLQLTHLDDSPYDHTDDDCTCTYGRYGVHADDCPHRLTATPLVPPGDSEARRDDHHPGRGGW